MQAIPNEYEKIKRLSSGNSNRFGEVFLLKRKSDGELVVLKSFEKSNQLGFDQLKNEAQFSFSTAGLPEVIDIQESENEFYFLKKYEEGISLNTYWSKIKKRKRLSKLKEIVSSLEILFDELEKNGIIHCDIKPENILVHEINEKTNCSIIDFGLAFYRNQPQVRKTIFQLAYSAPEIILNRLNCANPSTDVFSFCLVVYKLLSGRLPFSNSNPALQTQLQITYPIERPFLFNKKVWKVIEKGLKKHQFKKPPNKYSTSDLDEFLRENSESRYENYKEFAASFKEI
jgi:serine/threonine-protein kinase